MARLLVVLVAASCAASSPAAPQLAGLGTTHARETHAIEPPSLTEPQPRPVPSPQAQQLLVATDKLDTARVALDDAAVVQALYALVAALEVVSPGHPNEILRVREAAGELALAGRHASDRADLVGIAFEAASRALALVEPLPETDRGRLAAALEALRDATGRIDPRRPLAAQAPAVLAAFRASVRTVYAATGAPMPPFATVSARR